MGAAARVSRRRVIAAATDAVDKTNDLVARYNDVARAQNALTGKVESNDAARMHADNELSGRIYAQGAWLERLDQAKADDEKLTKIWRELDASLDELGRKIIALDDALNRRISAFREMVPMEPRSLLGRLRWLVFGR